MANADTLLTSVRRPVSASRAVAWRTALVCPLVLAPLWVISLKDANLGIFGSSIGMILMLLVWTCAYTDLRWKRIPNWATYPAFLWAWLINGVAAVMNVAPTSEMGRRLGHFGLLSCLLGTGVCFLIMLFIYRLARGGAGDVKLAVAIGALVGPENGISVLLYTYIAAGVTILCWIIWTRGPILLLMSLLRKAGAFFFPTRIAPPSEEQRQVLEHKVPLALFFAIGATLVALGWTMQW